MSNAQRIGSPARIARLGAWAMALVLVVALAGCGKSASAQSGPAPKERTLTLAAYSVPDPAYKKIIPAFQEYWKDKTGETVKVTESYGGSGAQARAVIDGLEADVVHLAMQPDVDKIQKAGLINAGWQDRSKNQAVPTTSLIVLSVRPGNPKGISDWPAVSAKGVGIITPDPKSSGGAQWNLLANWGSIALNGGTEQQAYDQVKAFYKNGLVLDKSARDSSNTFLQKNLGDVAVMWESDANIALSKGAKFDIVVPKSTILAETAATVVDANAKKNGNEDLAKAFVDFLYTPEAQEAFAETGLRPVDSAVLEKFSSKYPTPAVKLFTISDLGGWSSVTPKFFGDAGIYGKIQAENAQSK